MFRFELRKGDAPEIWHQVFLGYSSVEMQRGWPELVRGYIFEPVFKIPTCGALAVENRRTFVGHRHFSAHFFRNDRAVFGNYALAFFSSVTQNNCISAHPPPVGSSGDGAFPFARRLEEATCPLRLRLHAVEILFEGF